mmetsp:Transcript_30825/g.35227  ORF Transcript_30825/g.35227 Transcript_30825/m.35227 type:complete len:187 (-) Transcript_30825:400-960(-)
MNGERLNLHQRIQSQINSNDIENKGKMVRFKDIQIRTSRVSLIGQTEKLMVRRPSDATIRRSSQSTQYYNSHPKETIFVSPPPTEPNVFYPPKEANLLSPMEEFAIDLGLELDGILDHHNEQKDGFLIEEMNKQFNVFFTEKENKIVQSSQPTIRTHSFRASKSIAEIKEILNPMSRQKTKSIPHP